jgi:hypothetical protein
MMSDAGHQASLSFGDYTTSAAAFPYDGGADFPDSPLNLLADLHAMEAYFSNSAPYEFGDGGGAEFPPYDGWADFPDSPLNLLGDVHAMEAYFTALAPYEYGDGGGTDFPPYDGWADFPVFPLNLLGDMHAMEAYFSALVPYDSFAQTIGVIAIVVIAFDVALEVGRAALQMAAISRSVVDAVHGTATNASSAVFTGPLFCSVDTLSVGYGGGDSDVPLVGVAPASSTADMFV